MRSCSLCRHAHVKCSNRFLETTSPCKRCTAKGFVCSPSVPEKNARRGRMRPASDDHRRRSMFRKQTHAASIQTSGNPFSLLSARITDGQRVITKVLISIDLGSFFVKACFRVIYKGDDQYPRALKDKKFLSACTTTITWQGGDAFCPAQLAFGQEDQNCDFPLWGKEVEKALRYQRINESDVMMYLKPQLYDGGSQATNADKWHQNDLIKKLQDLGIFFNRDNVSPASAGSGSDSESIDEDWASSKRAKATRISRAQRDTIAHLWILFQQQVFIAIINKIWNKHQRELPWEPPPTLSGYEAFDNSKSGGCQIETAITVPAGASVKDVQFALHSARRAGIPSPHPIAEPSGAAAYVIQNLFEQSDKVSDSRAFLIADLGAGTFDVTIFGVMEDLRRTLNSEKDAQETDRSMCLKELIPGSSKWLGIATVNKEFRKILAQEVDVKAIVDELNATEYKSAAGKTCSWDETRFLDKCESLFEKAKRDFTVDDVERGDDICLFFEELGRLRRFQCFSRKIRFSGPHIKITPECMEEAFAPCLEGVISLIDQQLATLLPHILTQRGAEVSPENLVRDIQLVGGGSGSRYVCEKVREAFATMKYGHGIEVRQEADDNKAALMICKGALVLLADKAFVGERISRRGYCFSRDDHAQGSRSKAGRIFRCPYTGWRLKKNAAFWLLRVGERIKNHHEASMPGIRHLGLTDCPDRFYCPERQEWGWRLDENLFASDCRNDMIPGVWVDSPNHRIKQVAAIRFAIYESDVAGIEVEHHGGKAFKTVECKSGFIMDGYRVRWFIKIPRSGSFQKPELGYLENPGKVIDGKGLFELFDPACRQTGFNVE